MDNIIILIKSTLVLYWEVLQDTGKGFLKNWWCGVLPIFYVLVVWGVGSLVVLILPGIIGGLILGLLWALLIANYFVFLAASVEKEKILFSEIIPETLALFSPVLSVLFILYVISLVQSLFLVGAENSFNNFLALAVSLILVMLFNALPEIVYQQRGIGFYSFDKSFQFIKENFVEWFAPQIFIFFLVYGKSFFSAMNLIELAQINPLFSGKLFIGSSGWIVLDLFLMHCFMIFRGILFKQLLTSSRRKRIYNYRTNH
ncbi:MAG: hypothetical protein LBE20_04385 [Deltaproteobacteria bacterium]|jgi:hypothetical protein|nr:hypothetical protein [Deltaproteobacteria bacterium]